MEDQGRIIILTVKITLRLCPNVVITLQSHALSMYLTTNVVPVFSIPLL